MPHEVHDLKLLVGDRFEQRCAGRVLNDDRLNGNACERLFHRGALALGVQFPGCDRIGEGEQDPLERAAGRSEPLGHALDRPDDRPARIERGKIVSVIGTIADDLPREGNQWTHALVTRIEQQTDAQPRTGIVAHATTALFVQITNAPAYQGVEQIGAPPPDQLRIRTFEMPHLLREDTIDREGLRCELRSELSSNDEAISVGLHTYIEVFVDDHPLCSSVPPVDLRVRTDTGSFIFS